MKFYVWLLQLRSDADRNGCISALHQIPEAFLGSIFELGVQPRIDCVLGWAEQDPEQFLDQLERAA